jgi:hypothetical protein
LSVRCPKFQFGTTYALTILYCRNCEGLCRNNKGLHGTIDLHLFEKLPLDMLDDFTKDIQIQLERILRVILLTWPRK